MSDFQTVRQWLEYQATARPEQDFLIAPETNYRLNFGDLAASARSLANAFSSRGVQPGSHVAWLLPNGRQVVQLFVGCMAAGYVATLLSLLAQPAQLAYVLDHADCRLVLVSAEHRDRLNEALKLIDRAVEVLVVDPDSSSFGDDVPTAAWHLAPPTAETPALLMYTSGTTGRPKGVLLSHGNVTAGASFVREAHQLTPRDRVLAVLPMYHINAQIVTVLAVLVSGGSLVMPQRFSVAGFWGQASRFRCTWLNVVPTMIAYLLQDENPVGLDLAALRFCRSASAPLAPEHHRAFEARFGIGIIETMGLTETAAPVFTNPLDPARRRLGSAGQAFGNAARTVNPENGQKIEDGRIGEIQIRGPNVMAGYYKAAEETAKAFAEDGWLRTGDLGYCDPDGFYFITGRLKELIIKGGENIAPREIDEVLLSHPAVLEAAATAVPDPMYGQEILAGVVLKPGCKCAEASLRAYCQERLGRYKTPRYFRFMASLPKGPSGKIQRLKILDETPGAIDQALKP